MAAPPALTRAKPYPAARASPRRAHRTTRGASARLRPGSERLRRGPRAAPPRRAPPARPRRLQLRDAPQPPATCQRLVRRVAHRSARRRGGARSSAGPWTAPASSLRRAPLRAQPGRAAPRPAPPRPAEPRLPAFPGRPEPRSAPR